MRNQYFQLIKKNSRILLLILILLTGSFFRLYRLDAVPSGLSTDEAAAGINAESVLDGNLQLFYPPFDEPVFVYASAGGVALFGPTLLGLHFAAAAFGILALLAAYLLGRELFGGTVALFGAAGLAVSYWAVQTSRLGFRAIALPCLELFAFYFLWRAVKRKKVTDYALAGLLLALAIYTYPSSRVLPLIAGGFLLATIIVRRWGLIYYRGLLVYTAAFLLTLAPFGAYFMQHPQDFLGRFQEAASVSPDSSPVSSGLVDSLTRTLGMFSFAGDPQWKYNISGQPVFDPIWSLLFLAGILLALRYITKPEYLFLIVWFVVGLLPGVLTGEAPHNLRTIVSQPASYLFPALTVGAVIAWLRGTSARGQALAYIAIALLFAATAVYTYQDYFVRWANDPHVTELFYPDVARSMAFTRTLQPTDQVFMSAQTQDLITPLRNYFAWRQSIPLPQLFDASQGIVLTSRAARTVYLLPRSAPPGPQVTSLLTRGALIGQAYSDEGEVLFRAFAFGNMQSPQPAATLEVRFGDLAKLTGYDLTGSFRSGDPLNVTLYAQPLKQASQEGDYKFFVHLVDSTGYLWSQAEGISGDPAQWTSDELVLTTLTLPVPPDAPPKAYSLEIGMYSLQRGRLPVLDPADHITGTASQSAPLRLQPAPIPAAFENQSTHPLNDISVGDRLVLTGYDADAQVDPGGTLRLTLYWKAVGPSTHDDLLRLTLVDGSGQKAAVAQSELVDSFYPSTGFESGRVIRNSYLVPVSPQLAAGDYQLRVELVDRSTGEVVGPGLNLTSIQLSNIVHRFTLPPIHNLLSAVVGDSIEFDGYDLASNIKVGDALNITLYWQDKQSTQVGYTVFVHLIDNQNHVLAQRDRPPVNGGRPTNSWVPGEIIVDRYRIPLPADLEPGVYNLEIGMYDPASLVRLPIYGTSGERMEGDRLLIGNVTVVR